MQTSRKLQFLKEGKYQKGDLKNTEKDRSLILGSVSKLLETNRNEIVLSFLLSCYVFYLSEGLQGGR